MGEGNPTRGRISVAKLRLVKYFWVVVSIFFHPYLGKIPILTNIFQRG